jgi:hypothetical protein
MITYSTIRDDGIPGINLWTIEKSLKVLLECEIAFGGTITRLDETVVCIETNVMGCVDKSQFSGSPEDMKLLVTAAIYAAEVRHHFVHGEGRAEVVKEAMEFTEGNPRLLDLSAEMILGGKLINIVVVAVLADGEMDRVAELRNIPLGTLYAMLYLRASEGCSYEELMELAA